MLLLNKIPVLDKGYVALLDSSMTTQKLRDIGQEFYGGGEYPVALERLGTMTIVMKCPLFVQLALTKFNFEVVDANNSRSLEAYTPNAGEVGAPNRLDAEAIADDISRTTDALLINPKAYQADGCDRFVSQLTTPISTYTTIIVAGSYSEWCKFSYQEKLPGAIAAYGRSLAQIIETEWK